MGSGGCAPNGVQEQSPWSGGQGAMPSEAETLLGFGRLMDTASLLIYFLI